ncbi:unnamed protein product [Cochlearia groenlandica]
MQRTISLAAVKSSSSASLSLRPLMAKCRTVQNFPASCSTIVWVDKVYRNVCQLQLKIENLSFFKLACALPSHLRPLGSVSYAPHWSGSCIRSFGSGFRQFPGRYFSQVPNVGNKDKIVGGDGMSGGNISGKKKFKKKWKKRKVLASSEVEAVASSELVVGDVSNGIRAASPVNNDKSSSAVSVLEEVSVPKTKSSGSGSAKVVTGKYSSQDSNTGYKNNIVDGDEKAGGKKAGFRKFNKKWKMHKVLASSDPEAVTTNEPVIGDISSGIKAELLTEASPASNGNQAPTSKSRRRPRRRRVNDKSSLAVPVLEAVSVEESFPKAKNYDSGNQKSSSTKYSSQKEVAKNTIVEGPKTSDPSNSKSEQQNWKSKKASNAPKQKPAPQPIKNSIGHRGQNASKPLYPPSGKSVIVVESLTKAKIIQGYLGDMYEVLPSNGHIRDLAGRSGSVRPDHDFSMVWEIPSSAWTHIKSIVVALNGAENLILASDPDREGEAIAWHIIETLQQQGALHESMTVARVAFHEITESAIKTALKSPREINGDLVHAYLARRALDYLIGFNISPLLWKKFPGCPSAGRVQSAALALICDREREIDGFKPQDYWTVGIKVQGKDNSAPFSAHLTSLNSKKLNQLSIISEEQAQDIGQSIKSEGFIVKSTKKNTTRKNPPTPYITSTLQQDAANKLQFSTGHTMKVENLKHFCSVFIVCIVLIISTLQLAQKLYEGVQLSDGKSAGLITYMRTDGLHIADEAIQDIQSLVAERYGENFTSGSPRKYFKKVKNAHEAHEAHEAIRPTDIRRFPLSTRFLFSHQLILIGSIFSILKSNIFCQFFPDSFLSQIQLDIGNASESIFRAACSKVDFLGYQAVYAVNPISLSCAINSCFHFFLLFQDGDLLHIGEVELKQHQTQHPPRYSEGSLIKKLEELGIGRPSTYASIFNVLQHRNYVTIKSGALYPDFRGRMVSAFLTNYFTEVTDYSFTADMETELDNVSAGVTEWKGLLRDYWTRFSAYCERVEKVQVQQVEKMLEKRYEDFFFSSLPDPTRTCPSCSGGTLVFKVQKYGTGYCIGCDRSPSCKFVAKTFYGEEEEDEDDPPKNTSSVEEPKLIGLHPNTKEKVILKCGPYGNYVQLGEDKKGHLPQRANVNHVCFSSYINGVILSKRSVKDVNSITLEGALDFFRYPLTLGTHPEDELAVILKLSKFGFTVRHRNKMATVPKNMEPGEVTLEEAMKLLSGKKVTSCGRPPRNKKPIVDEEVAEECNY